VSDKRYKTAYFDKLSTGRFKTQESRLDRSYQINNALNYDKF